jgi:hypothetical protein
MTSAERLPELSKPLKTIIPNRLVGPPRLRADSDHVRT